MFNYWWTLKKAPNNIFLVSAVIQFFYYRIMKNNAARVSHRATFLGKPILPHGLSGIFISSGSIIGQQAVIFHQVTIGAVTTIDSKKRGSPRIGDNCYIGAGAKIIGNIHVGNNVRIGANTVVHKDVPDNSIVTQGSQIIHTHSSRLNNNYYFCRKGKWIYVDNKGRFRLCKNNGQRPETHSPS